MKYKKQLKILLIIVVLGALAESLAGIFTNNGIGTFYYPSIRGEMVEIYGKGVYRHMSSDVAIQGIAQDYVTIFVAIPLLIVSFYHARKGSIRGKLALSGLLLYFTLTYLFYIGIALYNELFLVAVITLFCSLFAFILNMISFDFNKLKQKSASHKTIRAASVFLLVIGIIMAMLWLSIIVPPLLDGSFYPKGLYHYSTLIVQGFDLSIFLPFAILSGILGLQKHEYAYAFIPTYLVFLSVLMTALVSKIVFMARVGTNVIPVVFIIPVILVIAIVMGAKTLKNIG